MDEFDLEDEELAALLAEKERVTNLSPLAARASAAYDKGAASLIADALLGLGSGFAAGLSGGGAAQGASLASDVLNRKEKAELGPRLKALELEKDANKNLLKLREELSKRQWMDARQDKQIQASRQNAEIMAGRRVGEAMRKEDLEREKAMVPGMTYVGEYTPTTDDAKKVKEWKAKVNDLNASIDDLSSLVRQSGLRFIPGEKTDDLDSAYTAVAIQMKEAAALGALSGPDYRLMTKMVGSPTSAINNVKLSKEQYLGLLQKLKARANNSYLSKVSAMGYEPKGGAQPRVSVPFSSDVLAYASKYNISPEQAQAIKNKRRGL